MLLGEQEIKGLFCVSGEYDYGRIKSMMCEVIQAMPESVVSLSKENAGFKTILEDFVRELLIKDKTQRRTMPVVWAVPYLGTQVYIGRGIYEAMAKLNEETLVSDATYERVTNELFFVTSVLAGIKSGNVATSGIGVLDLPEYTAFTDSLNIEKTRLKSIKRLENLDTLYRAYLEGKVNRKMLQKEVECQLEFFCKLFYGIKALGRENLVVATLRYNIVTQKFNKRNFVKTILDMLYR